MLSSIKKTLFTTVYSIIFVVGGFLVLKLFDKMELNLNLDESGFLLKLIDLNWFNFFSRPVLNGFFTLIVIIGIVMIVLRVLRILTKRLLRT